MASIDIRLAELRRETNPLFNDNRLKLGLFGYNGGGPQMTEAPQRFVAGWQPGLELAKLADGLGLEAQLGFSTWRGPVRGNGRHISHREFESFTWAAALGASISYSAVISTAHPALSPPALVAKASATIDNITGGRFALNIVAGSSQTSYDQFGAKIEPSSVRYERCQEYIDLLRRMWLEEDEFTFEGRFYTARQAITRPEPVQAPPPILSAGQSERGRDFAARNADIAFTLLGEDERGWASQIAAYRDLARQEYKRDLQVWTHGYLVIADSQREATDYLARYAEDQADHAWVKSWIADLSEGLPQLRPEQIARMHRNWAAGGGFPLVGTPPQILDRLLNLSKAGLGGMLLSALEPARMLERFGREVLPALEQAGLRRPPNPRHGAEPTKASLSRHAG